MTPLQIILSAIKTLMEGYKALGGKRADLDQIVIDLDLDDAEMDQDVKEDEASENASG